MSEDEKPGLADLNRCPDCKSADLFEVDGIGSPTRWRCCACNKRFAEPIKLSERQRIEENDEAFMNRIRKSPGPHPPDSGTALADAIVQDIADRYGKCSITILPDPHLAVVTAVLKCAQDAGFHLSQTLPGATGQFPQGKLEPNDEGELRMLLSATDELVRIDFGKATAWIAMPKAQAIDLAILILRHCGVLIEIRNEMAAKGGPV